MKSTIISSLQCSDEILQEIFRHTPVGVVLTDLHGTVLEVNDSLCAMLGYPRDQLLGHAAVSFMHADDVKRADDLLTRFRDGGEGSRKADCRLQARSGRTIWTSITVSVVRSAEGEPAFGIAFVEDIGERLAMEKALRQSATLYRQVVDDQSEMIVRWKPDGTRTFVNDAYARYFGLDESELIGTSFFPLVVKEDRKLIEAKIRTLTPESPMTMDIHRVILADGSVRWNEWTDRATFDEGGRLAIIQSIGRDVTDRVEASEALRRSESRHRRLFEHLPIAAWEVEWGGVFTFLQSIDVHSTAEFLEVMASRPEVFAQALQRNRLCEVNASALALAGVNDRDEFAAWLLEPRNRVTAERLVRGVGPLFFDDVDTNYAELSMTTAAGEARDVLFQWARVRQSETGWRIISIVLDLTEQKKNERELTDQKLRLEQAEAMAHLGHWEIDVASWTSTGSAEYWKIYDGFEGGPLKRSADEDLVRIHPEDRPQIEAILESLKKTKPGAVTDVPEELEFRVVRDDGTVRWVRSRSAVRPRPDGPPLVYGVDQDITEQKLAEDSLRRSERIYRDLFHSLPVAVWETDWSSVLVTLHAQGITTPESLIEAVQKNQDRFLPILAQRRIVEANQNALDLLGVKDIASLSAATWPPKVAPEQRAIFTRSLADAMFGRKRMSRFDLQITRADGNTVDVEALISGSEAAPGRVINTAVDVSERRKMERELLHSQSLLERAQTIAHLGSWEMSLENDELFGSREYWSIIDGHDGGEVTRSLKETMLRIHPEDRERVQGVLQQAHDLFLDGKTSAESAVEYRTVRDDGSIRMARAQGVFTRTASGDVRGYGIVQDVTELKRIEEAARVQREELMRADRMISLGILVSGVAHEINNPTQFILLNAPFLENAWKEVAPIVAEHARGNAGLRINGIPGSEMKQEIPAIINEIDRGAERIRSIVSELRTFGRDQSAAELRPSSINEIIEGSLRLMSNHIRRATSNFVTDLDPELPLVEANPQRLEQVVVNLVMNSCQALERPDAAIRVTTSFDATNNSVVMSVKDEGRGIPPENLRNIRDPFFTTKRAEGGMGLGLAVSDRIVQEHNGVLSFESESGRGTTATLSLPAIALQEH